MKTLAENICVELTWCDERDSKEWVEIELLEDGVERFLRVGDTTLSVRAWETLVDYLSLVVLDDEQKSFIGGYGKV
jgi:hypothetical protein